MCSYFLAWLRSFSVTPVSTSLAFVKWRDMKVPESLTLGWTQVPSYLIKKRGLLQDAEGKTPIHHAIMNQHAVIISLLMSHPRLDLTVKDKHAMSPFAIAMTTKNNKAAQAILDREPTACEQVSSCLSARTLQLVNRWVLSQYMYVVGGRTPNYYLVCVR